MWPFKKKTKPETIEKIVESVICIPGNWSNWEEFTAFMVVSSDGNYFPAANVLINAKSNRHFNIEFCEKDEKMGIAFKYAGMATRITEAFLEEITKHKSVVYISTVTGNLIDAKHLAIAAAAILKAGGLGVKIESAGKAFEKNKWIGLLENFEESNLYELFVVDCILKEDGSVYSCGMHNLGLRDTIISGEEFQKAVSLISLFSYYQIVDKPTIIDNQTFSESVDGPIYRITDETNQPNNGLKLFENQFGMWRLTKE